MLTDQPYIDVKKIHIAHEYILDQMRKCEYPRGRGTYGLIYALEGEAQFRFASGERIRIAPKDVLFVSPEAAYTIVTAKPFRHYTVNFDIHKESSSLKALAVSHNLLKQENAQPLERAFKKIVNLWRQRSFGYEMQAVGVLYELLSLLYCEHFHPINDVQRQRLQEAKEYIEQNFDQPIRLQTLAYLSDMSITNFRREWARLYAESPIAYRDSIRLYYAKQYLNCGYYTVSEVAGKCGFEDAGYFVRFFKKHVGITPREYQKHG